MHELPWSNFTIGNNREGTLSVFLAAYIYYAHLTSVAFEHSVCHESILTSFLGSGESMYGELRFQCYCLLAFTGFARRRGCFSAGVLRTFEASFR